MTYDSTLGTPKSEPKAVLHPLHHARLCSSVPSASIATAAAARAPLPPRRRVGEGMERAAGVAGSDRGINGCERVQGV